MILNKVFQIFFPIFDGMELNIVDEECKKMLEELILFSVAAFNRDEDAYPDEEFSKKTLKAFYRRKFHEGIKEIVISNIIEKKNDNSKLIEALDYACVISAAIIAAKKANGQDFTEDEKRLEEIVFLRNGLHP